MHLFRYPAPGRFRNVSELLPRREKRFEKSRRRRDVHPGFAHRAGATGIIEMSICQNDPDVSSVFQRFPNRDTEYAILTKFTNIKKTIKHALFITK